VASSYGDAGQLGLQALAAVATPVYAFAATFLILRAIEHRGDLSESFAAAERWPDEVQVECIDTGAETPTPST
jgi:ammonia channel protein AmtB